MNLPEGVPKPHINEDGSCSYIWMDLYKPSGKWAYGGVVYVGDARPWDSPDVILKAIGKNQKVVVSSVSHLGIGGYWTVVVDGLASLRDQPEYKYLWKRILQIGKE